ncbi:retrovirus-related pol polyprotein from transposon TNT 1-94 [Tanacetum coccineum]
MSGTVPPIPPPRGTGTGSPSNSNVNRVDTMPNTETTNASPTINVSRSVDDDLLIPQLLDSSHKYGLFVPMSNLSTPVNPLLKRQNQWSNAESRPSNTRDTKITALRLKFNAFKALEGEKVNGTYTQLKCLLNDLKINRVIISQSEVNVTFVNSLPRKWLSMNQTQRANNSIKNDSLVALYGKYHYEEGLIDDIYASETQRFTIQTSRKAFIFNNHFQDSDLDVEEDNRTNNEFMADLNAKYHERALLANQKRFYKRSGRVGSARKPMDKSKETCFACGKLGHFQKDCLSNKTSTPSYPSSNTSFNKPKPCTPSFTPNSSISQKDYKGKYKGLKAEMVVLSQRIDELTKGKDDKGKDDKIKSDKGLVAESFGWDDESVSLEDERTTKFKAFMAIADDEPSVGKGDA